MVRISSTTRNNGINSGNIGSKLVTIKPSTILCLLLGLAFCCMSFIAGTMYGMMHAASSSATNGFSSSGMGLGPAAAGGECEGRVQSLVDERVKLELKMAQNEPQRPKDTATTRRRFDQTMSSFAYGAVRTKKHDFARLYDMGVPIDQPSVKTEDVLILYSNAEALPEESSIARAAQLDDGESGGVPLASAADATQNCDYLHVILTDGSGKRRQCLAIMGQYESFHIQKFMRVKSTGGKLDSSLPLRFVNRRQNASGRTMTPPAMENTRQHWEMLRTYLNNIDDVLDQLQPLVERVAVDNTIVVLTCNMGQSELLMNFACSSRARGLSIENVLVFATDKETKELAEGLGMAAFYDEKNFGNLPSHEARSYADSTFTAMMCAKVVCVQVINMLGYDLLFQDVDIVWYKNPLEYFHDESNPLRDFDIYFQDDGAHTDRYSPYGANSGFYYVRHNARTRHFFTSLLMAGDLVMRTHSHQAALITVMSEHASLFGLRVKVLNRDTAEFPGGWHYHRRKEFMKEMMAGKVKPYIFHMSWTENKHNKLLFFRQMGDWYLKDQCIGMTSDQILASVGQNGDLSSEHVSDGSRDHVDLYGPCCSSEPLISCHYRDKASKNPCRDSPPIDEGKPSFW